MRRSWAIALGAALGTVPASGADEPKPPADFKMIVAFYQAGNVAQDDYEMVAHKGKVYQFRSGGRIAVINPKAERIELLDLRRNVQTQVSFPRIEAEVERLHDKVERAVREREAKPGRGDRILARMQRNMIEPNFQVSYDPSAHRLRLTNANVEIDATGEPDPDPARLALIAEALTMLTKWEGTADEDALPPFPRLEALSALTSGRKLRPTEVSILYRLTGPPQRNRWTYRTVDQLTPREYEALARVDRFRVEVQIVSLERFQQLQEQ